MSSQQHSLAVEKSGARSFASVATQKYVNRASGLLERMWEGGKSYVNYHKSSSALIKPNSSLQAIREAMSKVGANRTQETLEQKAMNHLAKRTGVSIDAITEARDKVLSGHNVSNKEHSLFEQFTLLVRDHHAKARGDFSNDAISFAWGAVPAVLQSLIPWFTGQPTQGGRGFFETLLSVGFGGAKMVGMNRGITHGIEAFGGNLSEFQQQLVNLAIFNIAPLAENAIFGGQIEDGAAHLLTHGSWSSPGGLTAQG